MADTLVYVFEPDEDTYAYAELAIDKLNIFNNIASLPIFIDLTQSPSVDLKITFRIALDEDENAGTDSSKLNDESAVKIDPSSVEFYTWDLSGNFTVKVEDWDSAKGTTFRIYIEYSGTNADSFTDSDMNSIKFTVLSTSSEVTPTVEFDSATLKTETYAFSV